MYKKILVALENGPADESLLLHVAALAKKFDSELLLLHVADGWAARCFDQLTLAESEEMKDDRAYLERAAAGLRQDQLSVATQLALGSPPAEIRKVAEAQQCDLIAMGSHGHRLFGDILHGSTITEVRHKTLIPVLLVRVQKK
jgi:nucleotide-binding universal stress UspA family protein